MTLFNIDGYTFTKLPIAGYKTPLSVVDNDGTGRMASANLPMFRDPAGTFYNLSITLGGVAIDGSEAEFTRLVNILESYGRQQFHTVTFTAPTRTITQEMYCTKADFELKRTTLRGETFWMPLPLTFIAKGALIAP